MRIIGSCLAFRLSTETSQACSDSARSVRGFRDGGDTFIHELYTGVHAALSDESAIPAAAADDAKTATGDACSRGSLVPESSGGYDPWTLDSDPHHVK